MRPSSARLLGARALVKAGLAAIALMIMAGCVTPGAPNAWRGTPINLVQGDGSLVKVYHRQPGAAPMDEDEVFRAVASDSSAWYEVRQAKEIRALTNSFSKKESMDSWFKRFRAETAKTPKTDLVAFLIDVHVDPYDFRTKQFAMCIEAQKSCAERQLGYAMARQSDQLMPMVGDLHHLTRSTGRYVLRVELPTDRTTFTQAPKAIERLRATSTRRDATRSHSASRVSRTSKKTQRMAAM